ncbi:MAG: hypothetical protein AB2L11_09700 [Syntrophobacteraceae bacterium]
MERPNHISDGAMDPELRRQVISSYTRTLEKCSSAVEKQSFLPFSKDFIRRAICEELAESADDELRSYLEVAFVRLESFLPEEEFEVITAFKRAGALAQELARSGDPIAVVASAQIVKQAHGDRAVEIQEKISDKMKRRLKQVRSISLMPLFQ